MSGSRKFDEPQLVPQREAERPTEVVQPSLQAVARPSRTTSSRERNQAVAMLAHELRNPLAVLSNTLALMRLRGEFRHEVDVMERQVEHMVRVIGDVLDAEGISRGKLTLRKRCIALAEIVDGAVEMLRPMTDRRRQRVELSVPIDLVVRVDPSRMTQVVANLIDNASKFSGDGARILVRAQRRRGGGVRLAVVDEGVGIEPQALSRIFDLYAQQHGAARNARSLGIGLALVRGIVLLHEGRVRAHSAGRGKGSTFLVDLPNAEERRGESRA